MNTAAYSLIERKLEAFDQLEAEFERCFQFVQELQGQKRFSTLAVHETVFYLHALWICECKDRLLSIPQTMRRYEGCSCLDLLQCWQRGENSQVLAFLQRKLDGMPFAMLAEQIEEARRTQPANSGLLQRILHGRQILFNRLINMTQAFDAIFALSEQELLREVQQACAWHDHRPEQLEQQQEEMKSPLYETMPHQRLAQRNMLVMNKVGLNALAQPTDLPGKRSERVLAPNGLSSAFAEYSIPGYRELNSPLYNNLRRHLFVDRSEQSDDFTV